jgi:hypothetical protein
VDNQIVVKEASNTDSLGLPWTEGSITYDNRPPAFANLSAFNVVDSNGLVTIDVTQGVPDPVQQNVSFALDRYNSSGASFYAKNRFPTNSAKLILTYTSSLGPSESFLTVVSSNSNSTTTNTLTIPSITVTKPQQFLVVSMTYSGLGLSGITYNGQTLTLLGMRGYTGVQTGIWYLANPPVGTANVVISFSSSSTRVATAAVIDGVRLTSPFGAILGQGSNVGTAATSLPIISNTNDLLISAVGVNCNQVLSVPTSQIILGSVLSTASFSHVLSSKISDGSVTTMNTTWSSSCSWGGFTVAIKPQARN